MHTPDPQSQAGDGPGPFTQEQLARLAAGYAQLAATLDDMDGGHAEYVLGAMLTAGAELTAIRTLLQSVEANGRAVLAEFRALRAGLAPSDEMPLPEVVDSNFAEFQAAGGAA